MTSDSTDKRTFVIVGGGDLKPGFLRERLEAYPGAFIIAADKGLEKLSEIGAEPDHILGDFDSVDPEKLEKYKEDHSLTERFPAEKDFTDTEAAIYYALEHGSGRIILLGMTGGRLDHFLANVQNLLIALEKDVPAVIEDPQNRLFLMRDGQSVVFRREKTFGTYLSLIPLTDELDGLTLRGVKYPLDKAGVRKGHTLCVSNEITADEAEVILGRGVMAVVLSKDKE